MAEIGFVLSSEQFTPNALIDYGIAAEKIGFDRVWMSDHFHPWQSNQYQAGQAWVTLSALAAQMPNIPFGTGVTCPTYRYNPAIVAQAFATLAVLYPGRVFLGVGSGEALNEQPPTGHWGGYEERSARLIEALHLIRNLWHGDWVSHRGAYYVADPVKLYTVPEQPIPIYIAASGKESMQLAGEHGDGLITSSETVLNEKEAIGVFRESARKVGKDPQSMSIHAETWVFVGSRKEALEAAKLWRFIPKAWTKFVDEPDPREILKGANAEVSLEEAIKGWIVGEDARTHIDAMNALSEAGATHIYIHSAQPDQQRVIDFYGREVLLQVTTRNAIKRMSIV
ncbi:MAG: TIGR03557 family F420-dependent LLM class oxidoreductase [Anaerolineae bacterium]